MGEVIYTFEKTGFVGVIRDHGRETYVAVGDDYYRIGDIPSDVAARLGLKLGDRIVVRMRTEIEREPAGVGMIPADTTAKIEPQKPYFLDPATGRFVGTGAAVGGEGFSHREATPDPEPKRDGYKYGGLF